MIARKKRPPLSDHVADVFASGCEFEDFDDWLRLVWWIDTKIDDADGGEPLRRKVAAIVMPRSSLAGLIEAARDSAGGFSAPPRRHS